MSEHQFQLAKAFAQAVTIVEYRKELDEKNTKMEPQLALDIFSDAYEHGLEYFKKD